MLTVENADKYEQQIRIIRIEGKTGMIDNKC